MRRRSLVRLGLLRSAREKHENAATVEPVVLREVASDDLQRGGAAEACVCLRVRGEQVVGTNVHDDKRVRRDESAAVGTRRKAMAVDVERNLSEYVGLIFFADAARVSGGVYEGHERVGSIGEANAARVADLQRRRLAAKED